jgi:hypothetical protein
MIAFWGVIQLLLYYRDGSEVTTAMECSFLTLCNVHMVVTLNLTPFDLRLHREQDGAIQTYAHVRQIQC